MGYVMRQIHIKSNGMEANNIVLHIKDLKIAFKMRQGIVHAVNGVSFQLRKGKVLGIVGESGSGKSVTARSILRIEAPGTIISGEIKFHSENHGDIEIQKLDPRGDSIRSIRWKEIAMVFQEPMTSFGPMHTFGNQIAEVLTLSNKLSKKEALHLAVEGLRSVGMPMPEKVINQYPHQISGGMRQRAMIAMALICNPDILIADEPTTALDVSTEAQILDVLAERQRTLHTSVLYISHNLGVVANIADEVIVMYLGEIVEYAPVSELFDDPKHPYTVALLNSIPKIDKDYQEQKLEVLTGSIPDPYHHPTGCKFHPRCPQFIKGTCDIIAPPLVTISLHRHVSCHLFSPSPKNC
jgi:oligopeptide/dipeptide ABC transporter ATP-binding protein